MWNDSVMPPDSKLLSLNQKQGMLVFKAPNYHDSEDMLYYFDGPVSFLTVFGGQKVLVTKLDETSSFDGDRWEVWAVILLSDQDIRSLKNNEKPFVQYWLDRPNFVVETLPDYDAPGYTWNTQRIWKDVEWHPSWLPQGDVKLFMER